MELPDNIEKDIVSYLQLEFGEDPNSDESLKISDLRYEGEYNDRQQKYKSQQVRHAES